MASIILLLSVRAEADTGEHPQEMDLVPHMIWLAAEAHLDSLEIIENLEGSYWQSPPDSAMTLGFVDGVYWIKASFEPPDAGNWIFSANNPTLREITIWQRTPQLQYELIAHAGIDLPFNEGRQFLVPDFIFQLSFPNAQTQELLIRVKQTGLLDLPATLDSMNLAINTKSNQAYANGIYYGLFVVAWAIAMVYFITTQDKSFLAFGLFILGFSLFFGYVDGVIAQTLWPKWPTLNLLSAHIALPLLNIGIPWFTFTFLSIPSRMKYRKRILTVQLYSSIAFAAICYWLGMAWVIVLSMSMAILSIINSLTISLELTLKQRDKIAGIYTAAWLFFGGYTSFIMASTLGLIAYPIHNLVSALKIAFAFQTAFLIAALAFRFRSLEAQSIQARSQSQSKSELLTRVSHEIRTPMNGILGLSRLLDEHITSEQGQYYRRLIIDSSEALLHVVNDLLDSRQIEEGKIKLHKAPLQMTALVRNAFETLRNQIEAKGLEANISVPEGDDWIMGDEVRLRQIIINLLGNAIKFTHNGSVSCTLKHDQSANTYEIIISDTGKGISPQDQTRILQPFEQVGRSKTEIYEGTGLGLYITNQLVKLMNGALDIQSTPGKGTRISVVIPAAFVPAPKTHIHNVTQHSGGKMHILAAEDNITNQVILKKILQNLGHTFVVANNGEEAYQLFKESPFDLVLMDCEMPILNGYNASMKIRNYEADMKLKPTPIYALTAHAVVEHQQRVKDAGMDGQLTKPFNADQLASLINSSRASSV